MVSVKNEQKTELHIFFLCDCSGSMAGERVAGVNSAIERTLRVLAKKSLVFPSVEFHVNVIRFANKAEWHFRTFEPLPNIVWKPITDTGGITALGGACELLGTHLETLKNTTAQLPPVILLLSDGKPTDDAGSGLKFLLGTELGKRASRFAVGVGDEANGEILLRMTGQKVAQTAIKTGLVELKDIVISFTLSGVDIALRNVAAKSLGVKKAGLGFRGVA